MKVKIKEDIQSEIDKLDGLIITTPSSMGELEEFAYGNHGSNDFVLMQMAVGFGYKMALNEVEHKVNTLQTKYE